MSRVTFFTKFQNLNFWHFFLICNFDFVLFFTWDLMWITSMGNHGAVGGISERRHSSCSSLSFFQTIYGVKGEYTEFPIITIRKLFDSKPPHARHIPSHHCIWWQLILLIVCPDCHCFVKFIKGNALYLILTMEVVGIHEISYFKWCYLLGKHCMTQLKAAETWNKTYLTLLPLVPHICVSKSGPHWFR